MAGVAQLTQQPKQTKTVVLFVCALPHHQTRSSLFFRWRVDMEYPKDSCTRSSYLIWNQPNLGNNKNKTNLWLRRCSLEPHIRDTSNKEVYVCRSHHKNTNNRKRQHSASTPGSWIVLQRKSHIWTPEDEIFFNKNHKICQGIQGFKECIKKKTT